jgi:predicted enzyme related to lactoylglutathione lyase
LIDGAHFLLYSKDAEADRRFLSDVLGFHSVDAGGGWLIFSLPPAEIAVHPGSENFAQRHADREVLGAVLYLMCDDLDATVKELEANGAATTGVEREDWGMRTTIQLPSGGEIGLYQPTHAIALRRGRT